MNRIIEMDINLARDTWNAVTSQPPTMSPTLALALRRMLEASTAAAPPVAVPVPPGWGVQASMPAPDDPDAGALMWGRLMVAQGMSAALAYAAVQAQWTKDKHPTALTFTAADLGTPPAPAGPSVADLAREAEERAQAAASVADMVPGSWSRAHILGAIINAGFDSPSVWVALKTEVGEPITGTTGTGPRASRAIAATQGSKFSGALVNMRAGMSLDDAYANQRAGVGGNLTDPEFSDSELADAWALAQSFG